MQIINTLLDSLFPPRKNERLLRHIDSLSYQTGSYEGVIYLSLFQEPSCSAAVTENKFHNNTKARKLLKELLEKWILNLKEPIVLVPVPLSRERLKERGYNQVTEIAEVVNCQNVKILENVIRRSKNTPPQTSLSKEARQKNVKGAFKVINDKELSELSDCTLVILDDVVTTGATLNAVRATLAPHLPPDVKLITLALTH